MAVDRLQTPPASQLFLFSPKKDNSILKPGASKVLAALTWLLRIMAQIYGHPLWQRLRLDNDLPLAGGVPSISRPDKPELGVADLLFLVLVRLPAPASLQGSHGRPTNIEKKNSKKSTKYLKLRGSLNLL